MSSDCALAEELYDLVAMHALQWFYILTSLVSIILVIYTARCSLKRTIFQNITKELIFALYVFIILYSSCLIIILLAHLASRYIAREKCDAQVPKIWCIVRYIITVTTFSFHALSSFHFGRIPQMIAARLAILLSFVYPIMFGVMSYYRDTFDGRTPYCSGFTANSERVLMINLHVILVLDILNALASAFLWKYNNYKLRVEQSFNLARSFHRRQNMYAMRQLLPVAVLHAAFYVVFFATVFFAQQIKSNMSPAWYLFTGAASNIIPHYCYLCPLIFLFLIRKGRFDRISDVDNMLRSGQNPNEKYFVALRDQWR